MQELICFSVVLYQYMDSFVFIEVVYKEGGTTAYS